MPGADDRLLAATPTSFGSLLRAHRLRLRLTQEALAERAGLGSRSIQHLERGESRPQRQTVNLLADALALSPAQRAAFEAASPPVSRRSGRRRPTGGDDRAPARPDWPSPAATALLPAPVSTFIGRVGELAELQSLLASGRVATVVGPGGVGKTRLAIQFALGAADRYPGGIWLIQLAPLTAGEGVPEAVARAMGLRVMPGQSAVDAVINRTHEGAVLLVLDNCEHVLAAAATVVATIVGRSSGVTVLATSRARLNIGGERVLALQPLSAPASSPASTAAELLRYDAAQLLVERAAGELSLNPDTCAAVAHICARLDGLPLAIELAAARLNALTPQQIADRLDDRLGLLTTGRRDDEARHQTLEALIAWSHDLLPEPQQRFFRWISTFAGGFSLEAAEAVWSAAADATDQNALDMVSGLVDQSLLVVSRDQPAARYRMLETIREYAARQLEASGDAEEARAAHAVWALQLAEQAAASLEGPHLRVWLDTFERERDNLLAALRHFSGRDDAASLLRLSLALAPLWWMREPVHEGRHWLELALGSWHSADAQRVRALAWSAELALGEGDTAAARGRAEEALRLARELGDETLATPAVLTLCSVGALEGTFEATGALAIRAHEMAMLTGNPTDLVWASVRRVDFPPDIGDATAKRRVALDHAILEEALAVATSSGSPRLRPIVVGTMSEVALEEGDFGRALRLAEQARSLAEEVGDRRELSWTCFDVGLAAARTGQQARAEAAFTEGLSHARQRGDDAFATVNLWGLAELALEQGRFDAAWSRGRDALNLARRAGDTYTVGACLHVLGRAAACVGQHHRATQLLGAADTRREMHHGEAFDYVDVWYTRRKPRESMTGEIMRTLQHALGAQGFEQAWKAGRAMSLEAASAYALEPDQ